MADITKFAKVAYLARKAVKDTHNLESLLLDAGVFGDQHETIVDSLVKQRTLQLEREMKEPLSGFDKLSKALSDRVELGRKESLRLTKLDHEIEIIEDDLEHVGPQFSLNGHDDFAVS
jgi:hypothetical protein